MSKIIQDAHLMATQEMSRLYGPKASALGQTEVANVFAYSNAHDMITYPDSSAEILNHLNNTKGIRDFYSNSKFFQEITPTLDPIYQRDLANIKEKYPTFESLQLKETDQKYIAEFIMLHESIHHREGSPISYDEKLNKMYLSWANLSTKGTMKMLMSEVKADGIAIKIMDRKYSGKPDYEEFKDKMASVRLIDGVASS